MSDTFEAQRTALHRQFRDRSSRQASLLDELSLRVEGNTLGSTSQEQIRSIAHSLAGAAGTFGFDRVSESAAELERCIESPIHANLALSCRAVVTQIRQATASYPATSMRRRTDIPVPRQVTISQSPNESFLTGQSTHVERNADSIMVVAAPDGFKRLSAALASLGYVAVDAVSITESSPEIRGKIVAAIICDDVEGALRIARSYSMQMPVLLIAADVSFHHRLAATRMGVKGVLPEPLDVVELGDWLGEIAPPRTERPYSILIVDGDELLADTYAIELRAAGMNVEVVTDGSAVLDSLAATSPDLVLLDTHLPGFNGIELAKIIRQSRRYLALPIVFLSGETDPHLQREARIQGGDDFISKPVNRATLVSLVAMRAKRGAELRSLMERDGLTGLLNYGQFMGRLSNELERCRRTGSEITLALIDLDHFRRANQLLGHVYGDRIIRGLAHVLTARLRRIDIVGRYGGDVLSVVLLDTSPEAVAAVFEQVRSGFAALTFGMPDHPYSVTASVGLAGSRTFPTMDSLVAASRSALKAAKSNGGDRVERLLV